MRFYNQPHRFYAGIDLHARTLQLCVLDQAGSVVADKKPPATSTECYKPLPPFGTTWSSVSSACLAGTDWPTAVPNTTFPSCWDTLCT
jgi:hypothetical protein